MGYIGSVILLLFNLAMVMYPNFFGIDGSGNDASIKAMKFSFITVGAWWLIFSLIPFYYLPSKKPRNKISKDIMKIQDALSSILHCCC